MKTVGLALSGGAAKSISALGVIHGLKEMGIEPVTYSGSSGGALVSVFAGAGYAPKEQVKMVMKAGAYTFLRPTWRKGGFFTMSKAESTYRGYLGDCRFEDLETPIHITCTDVISGEAVVYHNEGEVVTPLVASTSIPGIFHPVKHEGRLLIDGSVSNNLPVEVIRDQVDVAIGVVTTDLKAPFKKRSFRSLLGRATEIALYHNALPRQSLCDLVLTPKDLYKFGMFDISKAEAIFQCGYESVKTHQKVIEKLVAD